MTENDPTPDLNAIIAELGTEIRLDAIALVQAARRGDDEAQENLIAHTPDLKTLVALLVHMCDTILAGATDPDAVLTKLQRDVIDAAGDQ